MIMRKRRGGEYFEEGLKYLKDSMDYVWIVVGLFIFFIGVGFAFPEYFSFIDELLEDLIWQIEGMGAFDLVTFIFQNNVKSAFFALFFGVFLGVIPVINAVFNGIVLGYVLNGVWKVAGFGEFWRLLPHGIFELPAIFISLGLGIKLGMFVFAKKKIKELKSRFIKSMIVFLMIVLPLLVVAAVIEGLLIAAYG